MAILVTKATNSTNTYTLGSTDTDNTIYGSNVAETFTFNGTGNLSIADVAGADALTLTNVSPVAGVTIAVTGNNVILTSSGKTYTLAALSNGESITVNLGSDKQSIVITATDTTDANNVTTTNYAYTLNGSATPVEFTTASAIVFDTTSTTPVISLVAADDIVNSAEKTAGVVVSGTAETDATVTITWGGITQTATATGGNWTTTFLTGNVPVDGSTTISVVSTDLAGNVSSTATKTVVVDTVSPITTAPVVLAITSAALTNDTTPVVSGTAETGTTITAVIAGATYTTTATNGTWSVDTTPTTGTAVTSGTLAIIANGTNSISVIATDTAGNTSSPVAQTLTVDTTAPTLAITSSVSAVKIGETATITFTFDETPVGFAADDIVTTGGTLTGLEVNPTDNKIYTSTFTPTAGTASATASITVASGTYTDTATNAGGAGTTPTISIDTVAPTAPTGISLSTVGGTVVANTLNNTNTNFNATAVILADEATGGSAVLKVNGVTVATDSSIASGDTSVNFTSTVDSTFKANFSTSGAVTVDLIDAAGNTTTSIVNPVLTIDYVAPTAPTAPTVITVGGVLVSNTLNSTNTNLTASSTIAAGEATGGRAVLKLGTEIIATDSTILSGDTSVNFDLDTVTTSALQAAIIAGGNLTVELEDVAGNTVTGASTSLTVDYIAPTTTLSALALSADTGTNTTDFETKTAAQTITATLSNALDVGDKVWGSVNNGIDWFDITPASGTAISWTGTDATLVGSNTIKLKIVDAAKNEIEVASQAYVLDTTVPASPTFVLESDTGSSNSDSYTSDDKIIVSGIEAGATWEYLTDGGSTWTTGGTVTNGSASVTLAEGTFAVGNIKIRQTDSVGNTSTEVANTSAITIDKTATTAPVISTALEFKGNAVVDFSNASYATGLTVAAGEKIWIAPAATVVADFIANDSTITSSTSASIHTPITAGNYRLFHQDKAGNISSGSIDSTPVPTTITVDNTAPETTVASVTYIQKNGSNADVIRLTGTKFDEILSSGITAPSTINVDRLDFTKLVWNVDTDNQQVITAADIQSITVVSATQLDIVLKTSNSLYSDPDFLTGGTGVVDTLAITEGFIRDKAGNAATTDELLTAAVDTTTAYAMTLTGGATVDAPTVYVPKIELTAPAAGTTATFSGLNLKAIPTALLSIVGIQAGQTVTVNNLQKMDYVNAPNTISFTSTATTATTEKVVIDLTGAKALNFNNPYNVKTDITFAGGGAYMQLGSGVDYIELKTLAPAVGVGNLLLDYVENFAVGVDRVNLNQAMLTGLSGTTSANFTSSGVTDVDDAQSTVTFTGVDNADKTNLAVTGTNASTVTLGAIIDGNGTDTPESVTVTFTALTNDQTFTLNGVTIVAPSIGLTAHEVAILFANQVASAAAVINQIEVGSNAPSAIGTNIWISDIDGTISYDTDGDWSSGAIQLISVVTPTLSNILSSDVYLV